MLHEHVYENATRAGNPYAGHASSWTISPQKTTTSTTKTATAAKATAITEITVSYSNNSKCVWCLYTLPLWMQEEWGIQARVRDRFVNSRTSVYTLLQCKILTSFCRVLEKDYLVLSAYGSRSGAGVSLLVGLSLDANVNIVFAGDEGRLLVADVAVESFAFRVAVAYSPNIVAERVSFIRRSLSFLDNPKRLVLVGDWNAILDPKIDKFGRGVKRVRGFFKKKPDQPNGPARLGRLDYPRREM